jgi:hypothetical protein
MIVQSHRSRKNIEAYPAEVARTRLQNLQTETARADGSGPTFERLQVPKIRVANQSAAVFDAGNGVTTQIGEFSKGAPVPNRGGLLGGENCSAAVTNRGLGSRTAFDPPNDTNLDGSITATAAQPAQNIQLGRAVPMAGPDLPGP